MKKIFTILFCLMLGISAMAQQKIQLRSTDRAECLKSDMTSLQASFSFSTVEAQDYETSDRGTFSELILPNTVMGGNEGDPQIPVINQLIAVPVGAQPTITVTSYSTTDYDLAEYGMKTLMPRQLPVRKSQKPEDVPFIMNEAAYQSTRGLNVEPQAVVEVVGTMRGVQLGKMTIEPVSYDPVNNKIRVFNDIEVEVSFDGADAKATEDLLIDTYSPYFDIVYKQLFNGRAVRSAYDDHPDLYQTPVKMLVVTTQEYKDCDAFQNWLTWKKQKGIDVDVQLVTSSTSSSNVRSLIQSRYNTNHPTFLVIVGDESAVKYYTTYTYSGNYYNPYISDLQYASMDDDVYHDMFMSRMSVSSTTELGNLVNKILTYEKYTMSDPNYLNNVLLIAGNDTSSGNWDEAVGRPTIQYAVNNYYNAAHGFANVYKYNTSSTYTGCYNYLSSGVGFTNYTAHGDIDELSDPQFTVSNVANLTNNDKYFWLVANCCLSANWGNTSTSPCLGEAMIRAANKGAFGYIGSVPESWWYEDYYFGVGAFSYVSTTVQTTSSTTTGMYDAIFDDTAYNTLNSVPYIGNVAVTYAHAAGYQSSVTDEYYWRAYQCLGDGSVMPYTVVPSANSVSHANEITAGESSFRVNADAGSYVSITVNNEIIGVAAVPANANYVDVQFTTEPQAGQTAMIVVTRNQRQPYINGNVQIIGSGEQYEITANVSPTGAGTVEGTGTYYENTHPILTAVANHGYAFERWNDNNTDNPRTITVTGNATYTAYFRQLEEHHCTYNPQQTHGTISVSPENAYAGDIVTLTANPAAGYMLDHWTVTTVSKEEIPVDENNQFVMPDSEVNISATFRLEPVDLTVYSGSSTNQYIPMYGYYFDEYTKSECIIPYHELSDMVNGTITAITFYPSNVGTTNSTWGSAEQTVFLKEVSDVNLGGSFSGTSGATIVKQGLLDMPTAGTAYTITFDTPYTYEGGNLLIGVYNNKGAYNKVEWYGTGSLSSGVSAYGNNSSALSGVSYNAQSFLPKTTFTYTVDESYCARPENLHVVGEIGPRTVTMGWDVASGDVFQYAMVQGHNIDLDAVTYDGTTPTGEMTWNNLTADNDYTVVIRRKCDDDNYSQPVSLEFHTAVSCPAPTGLAVSNLATHGATFTWTGFSDSYVLMVGEPSTPGTVFNANFESGDLSGLGTFTNDATYPWVITTAKNHTGSGSYSMKSSNEGINGSTSSIEVNVNLASDGTLSFYCWASCESPSSEWDYGVFYIDGEEQEKFLHVTDWVNKSYSLTAGQHTLTWAYSKDSSAAGNDDCFYVDDITITGLVPSTWTEYTANTNAITINDLSANTYYFAKVKGNCGNDGYSQDSDMVSFTTLESCPTPSDLTVDENSITAHGASLSWTGDTDSYNIMLGERTYLVDADFETGDFSQANFTNDASYPWTVVANTHSGAYCAKSATGNDSQTSALELSVTLEHAQTLTFSAMVSSESGYDKAYFSIDGTVKINGISGAGNWEDYTYTLAAGTHALRWYYTKDSSVASNDDCFYVDDIKITGEPNVLATYTSNTNSYDLTGLTGETTYNVQVQGVCDGDLTGWSNAVSFTTLMSCPAPTGLTAGTPGSHSVTLSWNYTGDATTWQICLNGDEGNLINVTTNPYTLTGLASGTTFTAKVRAYCDAEDQSIWSNTVTFTTDASCPTPTITNITAGSHTATITTDSDAANFNLRYREASSVEPTTLSYDFENGWQNWTAVQGTEGTSSHNWMHNTEYTAYSSNGNVIDVSTSGYNDSEGFMLSESYISAATSGGTATGAVYPDNYLISPKIRLGGSMTFYAAGRTTDYQEKFTVMVSTTKNISDFVATSFTVTLSSQSYTQYTVDLSSYSEMGEGYVIFHHYDCTDQHMLRIDDVVITEPAEEGNEWIEVSGLTITGLDSETTYEVQAQANCGTDDGVSAWSSIVTFTTDAACPAPRNLTASNLTQNSATISWTGESDSYTVNYRQATINGTTQTELFTEGFENDLAGWTTLALGYSSDLTNWQTYDATNLGSDYNNTNHGGSYVVRSKSYAGSSVGDVTVDNWLISPQMTIGDGMTFWVSDDGEWHEHLEIRVCTAATFSQSTLTSDFALVAATAVSVEDKSWEEKTIDLSAYAGQTGYIAIRNNDTGKDFVCLDDITVYQTVNSYDYGTTNVITTNTNSCDLTGLTPETLYEVKVQGDCGSEGTSLWSTMYFTTPDACGAPTDLVASDITNYEATLNWANTQDSYDLRYRKVYFYEGFESETMPTGWTTIDANSDGNTWGIGFATAHTGNNGAYNLSYIYNTDGTTPNDYLVSPLLDLQGTLRVWLSGYGNDRYEEHFAIYVSTTGNTASDFTNTLVGETTTTNSYVEYTADLNSYAGQKGYIAIRHFNCSDQYYLYVDDFGIYGSEDWVTVNNIGLPTTTLSNLSVGTTYEWQVRGLSCNNNGDPTEWSQLATFTTKATFDVTIPGYETYEGENSGWVFLASPIAGSVQPTAVVNLLGDDNDLYSFDQNAEMEWLNYKQHQDDFSIVNGQGYLYASKETATLQFSGQLNNEDEVTVYLDYNENARLAGFNLVGNPFLDVAFIDRPYYHLDENGAQIVPEIVVETTPIQAFNGVLVQAMNENDVVATFTRRSNKSTGNGSLQIALTKAGARGSEMQDKAIVSFNENDRLGKYVFNESFAKLYIPQEDEDYAIVSSDRTADIPLYFEAKELGKYTLSFTGTRTGLEGIHLIDFVEGNDIDLAKESSYTFIGSANDMRERFKIVFKSVGGFGDGMFAYQSGDEIIVSGEGTLQIFDALGRFVGSREINGVERLSAMPMGVYIFRLIGEDVQTQKIVVR